MKKSTIWSIAIALGIALAALIGTQFYYLKEVVESRQKQFDENVKRALYQAARKLELQEVQNNLEKELFSNETMHRQQMTATETAEALKQADADSDVTVNGTAYPTPIRLSENAPLSSMMSEKMRKKLLHQKELLNEVIYNTLYLPEDRPLEKRMWTMPSKQNFNTTALTCARWATTSRCSPSMAEKWNAAQTFTTHPMRQSIANPSLSMDHQHTWDS